MGSAFQKIDRTLPNTRFHKAGDECEVADIF